jgi:serpin B
MKLATITAALALSLFAANLNAVPASAQVAATPAATGKLVTANNDFGFRLLHSLLAQGDENNVVISPLSVSLALGIVFNGAGGVTRDAMAHTLGISSLDDQQVNGESHQLLDSLAKADPAVQLQIANALWVRSGFALNPDFVERTREYFDATVRALDFAGDPQASVKIINDWASDHTHGKIPGIIDRLNPQTRLVVTDAVYFKGRWTHLFDKKLTRPRAFYLPGGTSVTTPMMEQSGRYPYFETPDFQAVRLAYGDGHFDMYLFLPRKSSGNSAQGQGLSRFLGSLNETNWNEWTNRMSGSNEGKIVLPKFELNYSRRLNQQLESMGMGVAFDPDHADLSRIAAQPAKLWIDFVQHKTYIKVDEQGTEAAAVTAVGIGLMAVMSGPQPFEMIVDHPFFFAITEHDSGSILFTGIITNPAAK